MRLRAARPEDADDLAATVAEGFASYRAFAPEGWTSPDVLELALGIAVHLRDRGMRMWVAEDAEGAVVGQVAYQPAAEARRPSDERGLAHLGQLFVRRSQWGSGLAGRLVARAVDDAAAQGYRTIRLFTPADHARARRFYEREGWRVAGERFREPSLGLDLVEYRREV